MVRSVDGSHVRQLTFDPINHEDPAWSPDGKQIAFVYLSANTERIALIPAAGGPMELISPVGEHAIHPTGRRTADSSRIAPTTIWPRPGRRRGHEDCRPGDAGHRVLITGGVNTSPAWPPDGRRIAFRRMLGETNSEVFVADSDGTHVRNLTNSPASMGGLLVPDGHRLAFASNRDETIKST